MENKKVKITQFQKLALTGIALVAVLLVTLIVVISLSRNAPAHQDNGNLIREPAATPEPPVTTPEPPVTTPEPETEPESSTDTVIDSADISDDTEDDNKSLGTRFGEMFISGSNKAFDFLSDFNDVVNVTGFFKGGYLEFYDAVRAESGEELIEMTVDRIAKNNDVTVLEIEIIDEVDSVNITINSDNETSAENFRRDLEKLSFISEANYESESIDDDGMFVYKIILVISV